ncbi:MAG TPA: CapA family protein [Chitinophaga sp.]
MPTTSSGLKSAQLLTFNVIGLVALPCFFSGDTGVVHSTRQLPALISHELPAWQDPKDDTISISIVGDMMVGSSYPSRAMLPPEQEGSILQHALPYLQQTDLRIGNLESVVSDSVPVYKKCGVTQCYAFCTPLKYAQWYKDAGFEYLNLSNNHSFDFGPKGVQHTLDFLSRNNIRTSGVQQHPTDTLTVKGTRIGFVSFAPHNNCLNLNDDSLVQARVTQLRPFCDVLVVFFHGGAEGYSRTRTPKAKEFFYGQDRGNVVRFAHLCVDAGADMVIGSGPHVVRGMELYKEKLIAYSLGNFATYSLFNLKHPYNLAPLLQVKITSRGQLVEHKVVSFLQYGEGVPKPDSAMSAFKLMRTLSQQDFGYKMDTLTNGYVDAN